MTVNQLEQGREAAARGDFQEAYRLVMEADARQGLQETDLPLLADLAYAAGHLDVTIETWERAHAQSLRAGNRLAAATAAMRVALHLLLDTALMAPIRGWIRRAERLLEDSEETPVHAWIAVVRNYERMLSGDFHGAREWARRAIEVGGRCEPAAAAIGRIAEARSLILDGDVKRGLDLLDEAAVAVVSGELDPVVTGIVYCELVCGLQALGQYDLAEEWTQAMEMWRHGQPVGSIHGRCRVHRAEILRLRGSTNAAEEEALGACRELRPYLRRELGWPLTELGKIRLRKGDLDGAEQAFLAAHEVGWDPQPGLAMLHAARGDVAAAAISIRHAIDHPSRIPSKELPPNTELRRAPLLEAQVEIALAAGHIDEARHAAEELATIAASFQSKALAAAATLSRGRVRLAEGNTVAARLDFEAAVHGWSEVGAPHEAAVARMALAEALRAEGHEDRAILEFRAAGSVFERVGSRLHAERAARAAGDDVSRSDVAADGGAPDVEISGGETKFGPDVNAFHREGEFWTVTFEGRTIRLRDAKGLRYLARLLGDPGREFHVLDLAAMERDVAEAGPNAPESGSPFSTFEDADPLLDARAKDTYRRRLREIDEDLEEARMMGDFEREEQAATEREILLRELSRAVGLGGRDRRAGTASERARAGVTRAIRSAMARIRANSTPLGEHLDRCIRTGTYCAYLPDSRMPASWIL